VVGVLGYTIVIPWLYTMRDIKYKAKGIRMSEEVWEKLNDRRKKSNKSWNLFLTNLLCLLKENNKKD